MSISRYAVVCRHVSPRPLGLTGALRVRQSLVVEIVQRLREKLSIASRCPPWSPRFGLRQHTLANSLSKIARVGSREERARTAPPARSGSQLKCDGGGRLRGPRHPPLVSGRVPEVVDVPIDRTRLVHPERGQKDDAIGEIDPGDLCSHAVPPPP
jgi:hypothetical protein